MRETDWIVRIGDQDFRAPDLETVKEWSRWGRIPTSAFVFDPQNRTWRPASEVAPLAEVYSNQPARLIAVGGQTERRNSASGCQIAGLSVLGIILAAIVVGNLVDEELPERRHPEKRMPETSSPADSGWRPAAGHLWSGITVYDRASKSPVFQILGGNENYLAPDGRRIRGVKVRYPAGSVEWKDRTWLVNSGEFVVRVDDPALARKHWYVYEY